MVNRDEIIGTIWSNSYGLDNNDQARLATAVEELLAEAWLEGEAAGWNNATSADRRGEIVYHNPYRPRENYLKDLRD